MKTAYQIDDLCAIFHRERSTIWRWRKKAKLPKPDINDGANPVWFRTTLEKHLPNFTEQLSDQERIAA